MADSRALFGSLVARLARRARQELCIRRSIAGLFFGLLPGAVVSLLSGSVALPVSALPFAVGTAAIGCAAGLVSAISQRVDRRRLLISADKSLGSRELVSTAHELAESEDAGIFAEAVLEDASQLLARTAPRTILGRLRVPLAPFAVLAALVTAAGLLFPVDLRWLFQRRASPDSELAQIGEDLRNSGLRLAEDSRASDLSRSLALSRELAQLGSDLAAKRVQPEEALDRMSELESGLAEEYQLRMEEAQSGEPGTRSSPEKGVDKSFNDLGRAESALGDALDRLRQAQRQLSDRGNGVQQGGRRGLSEAQPGSPALPPGQGNQPAQNGRTQGRDRGSGGAAEGAETADRSGESAGSGVGTLPAPVKRGAPSDIIDRTRGPGLQVQGKAAEGDSTRLLARALPRVDRFTAPRGGDPQPLFAAGGERPCAGRGPAETERVREGILHRHRHIEVGSSHGRAGTGGVGEGYGARAAAGDRARHRRARGGGARRAGLPVLRRPRAAGGRARAREDHAHQEPRAGPRPGDLADPVHSRPDARGHHRHERPRAGGDPGRRGGAETRRYVRFQKGPVFANIVLADEINRATPKTQSALLEAMQEQAVTVGGTT